MMHFNTAYPTVTNFLPVLIWNGYSQEHHSMCTTWSNEEMTAYWKGHGFENVFLVDAKNFDDKDQAGAYVDSSQFSFDRRLAFAAAVLAAADSAAKSALGGKRTVMILKQLKGAGVHKLGAKAHNLYPADTLDAEHIVAGLQRRALAPEAWQIVRDNFSRAGGGSSAKTAVTESVLEIAPLPKLPIQEFAQGDKQVPATAFGALVAAVGKADPRFVVTNADGNEASAMANINVALKIRHPVEDALYFQGPAGQVYEPLKVTQAMAELRRKTPSVICMFTAGALEQGRNGWTHQRPEIENYFAAQMRNGNVYPLFPCDANQIQVAYDWALGTHNKGVIVIASKSPLPVYTTLDQAREGVEKGAVTLYETAGGDKTVVFAVTGDMALLPVFEAKDKLEAAGRKVRIVSAANPRRLYRPTDVAWDTVSEPDNAFMDDDHFNALFDADVLIGVSGGPAGPLEPIMLRTHAAKRDVMAWKRGETTASAGEIMAFNGLTGEAMAARVQALLG
jgi:phosphoketolase